MRKSHFFTYTFLIILFSTPFLSAQITPGIENKRVISSSDSVLTRKDSTTRFRRTAIVRDSVAIDSTKKSKDALDAPVAYTANDSTIFDFTQGNKGYLYGSANVTYKDIALKAENIDMSMDSSLVHATYGLDSIGQEFGYPEFKQGSESYEEKSIRYNFKTQKGYITHVITQQDEGYLIADRAKKNPDNSFFIADGKYTTCDNHEHPHFYMMLTKAKVRPKKNVVTGPAYLVIEDLPVPIAIPFGFFPFTSKYSSGIIMPTYGDDLDRGFSLRNGGYYFALSENIDLALTGEFYTKGSWGINARSSYKKRYRYSGSFNLGYLDTKFGDKDVPSTYSNTKDFNISWSHQQDPKANMYRTLSASVNYSSTSYNQNQLNNLYSNTATSNTKNSTVNLTQRIPNSPFTLSGTMSASQTTSTHRVDMTLPGINIAMTRIFPFKRKDAVGAEKWYEKISMSYSGDFRNSISTSDSTIFRKGSGKDWQTAMMHKIPVSATFNVLNYLNITPTFNYNERWYTRAIDQGVVGSNNFAMTDTTRGFKRVYDYNFALSFQTKLYGMYTPLFLKNKLKAIRHVFTPSISFNYTPNFGAEKYGYYKTYYYYDANGVKRPETYSPYRNEQFGVPGNGATGGLSFDFQNNIEAKIAAGDSTRIISLIDNLDVNFSYNMMADSFKVSNIGASIRLKLTKSLTLNLTGAFDPYTYVSDGNGGGRRVDVLRIQKYGTIGRLMSTSYSLSPSINQDTFNKLFGKNQKEKDDKKPKDKDATDNLDPDDPNNPDETKPKTSVFAKQKEEKGDFDADGYMKSAIKWNLSASFGMSYGYDYSKFNEKTNEYAGKFTYNLGINGSIQPTKNWNFNFTTSYDVHARKFAYMNCTLSRSLHCWTLSASFIPIGPNTSYYVSLRATSKLLQDLKYEQRGQSSSYDPQWY